MQESWNRYKIKQLADIINGYSFKSELYQDDGINVIRITNVDDGSINNNNPRFYSSEFENEIGKAMLAENDILMSLTGNVGIVGMVEKSILPAGLNQRVASIRIKNSNVLYKFMYYYFRTKQFREKAELNAQGIAQLNLSTEWLGNDEIFLPPISIQKNIINFLDRKVIEIDKVIEKTKETIEDYKRFKQSIITETITKGISKNTKMNKSQLEWIKEYPEKWETYKTKDFFEFGKGLSITKADLVSEGEKVISYGQIHSKDNIGTCTNEMLFRYVPKKYLDTHLQSLVSVNDFIFADTSEDLDGCGNCVYIDDDSKIFAGYHTIILRPKIKENIKYLAYLFLTDCWRSQLRCRVSGIKLYSITQKILKETTLILPPLKERKLIVNYLDKKCKEIDKLIKSKNKIIEELEQYKKSLIYEYVTGKKEITNSNIIKGEELKQIKINCKDNIFAQAILLCKVIEKLNKYNLGRVKAEKTLYLIEKDIGFDFDNNYVREAAGPLSESIYKCESVVSKKNKWIKVNKVKKHIEYEILSDFSKYSKYYDKYYSDYDNQIESIIEKVKNYSTDKSEMVATLYASWNDFIIKKEDVTDIKIVKDVRENWNDTKKRFNEQKWLDVLKEMKEIELTPKGYGNLTIIKEN